VTVVGKVTDEGLFGKTELKEGMTVVSVNDKAVKDMELQELLSMLKDSTGDITIVAETPGYSPSGSIARAASSPSVVSSVAPPRRVTATVDKDTAEKKLGISIRRTSVSGTTLVGRVSPEGPFSASGLEEGMKVVSIKAGGTDLTGMELEGMLDSLRNATGEVTIVAETMTGPGSVARSTSVTRASSVAGFKPLPPPEGAGHSVIFKKTFKQKGMGNVSQALSFHGQGVDKAMVDTVNRHLGAIRYCATANPLKFTKDDKAHYVVEMNHDCQKYHEEDALAAVFDAMEVLGWGFRFQYASQYQTSNSSHTFRDIFIFAKLIEI
jgi:PDZ domain